MNKWFKIVPISIAIFIVTLCLLNFMPLIKSDCGCSNAILGTPAKEQWVPLNYFIGCFCTEAQVYPDNFPAFLKSKSIQNLLVIIPFILAILSAVILRKKIR